MDGMQTLDHGRSVIAVELRPIEEMPDLAQLWTDLEARADGSFFLSWRWIGTWLHHRPPGCRAFVLTARRAEGVVGLAVLVRRDGWRIGALRTRRLLLHESGDAVFDRLSIEYNGILADRRCAAVVTFACLEALGRVTARWDELVLSGLDPGTEDLVRQAAAHAGYSLHVHRVDCCRSVDLNRVRSGGYRAALGSSTRSAVNRSIRLYQARGGLEFRVAEDAREALALFDAMEALHRAAWKARGKRCAFDNPAFGPLHRDLIGSAGNAVRLCRVSAGGQLIGVLYNLVHQGRVLNYQSGFAYEPDNRLKPGLVSHVLAIEDAIDRGEHCYDFMAYAAGHKDRLSNARQRMVWLTIGPDRVGRRIDTGVRTAEIRAKALCKAALCVAAQVGARIRAAAAPPI